MTPRQSEVLSFIRKYRAEHGLSPTIEEIGEELSLSKTSVYEHMQKLLQQGQLIKTAKGRTPRAFQPANEEVITRAGAVGAVDRAFKAKKVDPKRDGLRETIVSNIERVPAQN